MITEIITRRRQFRDEKFWVTTNSIKMDGTYCKWSNCFYIHFNKKDFPNFVYPKESYYESSFADIAFHGGVTFYEETIVNGNTYVKVGCDYQHLYDEEYWGLDDNGLAIISGEECDRMVDSFKTVYRNCSVLLGIEGGL